MEVDYCLPLNKMGETIKQITEKTAEKHVAV